MVYTAASPSLAVLEVLVHLDLPSELLPDDYQLLTIAIPDDAAMRPLDPSPTRDDACQEAGDAFLEAGDQLVAIRIEPSLMPSLRIGEAMNASFPGEKLSVFDARSGLRM